jgi:glycosyltransferase involved in cell wall biosynthesis
VRVVVDAVPVRGGSLHVVTENLVRAWAARGDELHVVLRVETDLDLSDEVAAHTVAPGSAFGRSRLWATEFMVPRVCRQVKADVMVGMIPATTALPLPCPRVVIAHDVRYLDRPDQFPTRVRLVRRASYSMGYRRAAVIACVSERTRRDLIRAYPKLDPERVRATHLGADHVLGWPRRTSGPRYALAFGQWNNKNVDLVVEAWALLRDRGEQLPLVIVGLNPEGRAAVEGAVSRLDLADLVTVRPWLSPTDFQRLFTSASLVVFPSEYEGFGLPAIEAMRLGIPLVVTPEPALLEITGGLATVMDGWNAPDLASAVPRARATSGEQLRAGVDHATHFTWRRMADQLSSLLASGILAPA